MVELQQRVVAGLDEPGIPFKERIIVAVAVSAL
jgi:hypothetical protein